MSDFSPHKNLNTLTYKLSTIGARSVISFHSFKYFDDDLVRFPGGGLSSGETAGVVIGVLLAVLLLGVGVVLFLGYFGIVSFGPFANRNPTETRRLA